MKRIAAVAFTLALTTTSFAEKPNQQVILSQGRGYSVAFGALNADSVTFVATPMSKTKPSQREMHCAYYDNTGSRVSHGAVYWTATDTAPIHGSIPVNADFVPTAARCWVKVRYNTNVSKVLAEK